MADIGFRQEYLDIEVKDQKTFYRNITQDVQDVVTKSDFKKGIVLVHTLHTTAGFIKSKDGNPDPTGFLMQEDEPLLMEDIKFALDSGAKKFLDFLPFIVKTRPRLLDLLTEDMANFALESVVSLIRPLDGYKHDNFDIRIVNMGPNERKNAEAHLKAAMIKESVLCPFNDGRLNLGKWQSIIFFDFDPVGRKKRKLTILLMGEQ